MPAPVADEVPGGDEITTFSYAVKPNGVVGKSSLCPIFLKKPPKTKILMSFFEPAAQLARVASPQPCVEELGGTEASLFWWLQARLWV